MDEIDESKNAVSALGRGNALDALLGLTKRRVRKLTIDDVANIRRSVVNGFGIYGPECQASC